MVFKVVNDLFILICELRSFVILSALLVLEELLDLLDLYFLSSIFFTLCIGNCFCTMWWWVTFMKTSEALHIFMIFLSCGGSCLLLAPPLWANNVSSELVCWLTLDLVYLSLRMRFPCLLLGYRSSTVGKLFSKSTFNFLFCFSLFWIKYMRGTFPRYPFLLTVFHLN